MNNSRKEAKLLKMIKKAIKREDDDDHLNSEERKEIVDLYSELNPDYTMSGDLDRDFVSIIM